jgi:hypothetical protein
MFAKTLVLPVVMAAGCFAAPPGIGIVTASGHFTLDRSEVWGNTTLFDGGNVETGSASSEAILRNGVKIQLAAASRASVRENRLTLLQGTGQIAARETYEVNAGGLSIRSASGVGRMRVGWSADGRIEVAALSGSARVATRTGMLLASIPTGKSMQFALQQQAGVVNAVTRVGCLLYKDTRFFIQDQDTQEIVELAGVNLGANAGNRMNVTGVVSSARPVLTIASSVMNVTSLTVQAVGGCLSVAAVLGAQTDVQGAPDTPQAPPAVAAPPAGGSTPAPVATGGGGMSTGAKVAIAAVAIGGGAGAAIALAGGKKSTSP